MRSVLVGINASDGARAACMTGSWLANRLGLDLVLAHVRRRAPSIFGNTADRDRMEHMSAQNAFALLEGLGPPNARRCVACGEPAETLAALAGKESAALIVIGSRGHGPLRSVFAPRVSRSLVRQAYPLVVVPPAAFERVLRLESAGVVPVVCGFDGSRGAEAAMSAALELAGRARLDVKFVNAVSADGSPVAGSEPVSVAPAAHPADDGGVAEANGTRKSELGRGHPPPSAAARVTGGGPADVLKRVAREEDAALIIVGTTGRGRFSRAISGSVSAAVAASPPCPVLIVPTGVESIFGRGAEAADHSRT